jgi:hypothetical protein
MYLVAGVPSTLVILYLLLQDGICSPSHQDSFLHFQFPRTHLPSNLSSIAHSHIFYPHPPPPARRPNHISLHPSPPPSTPVAPSLCHFVGPPAPSRAATGLEQGQGRRRRRMLSSSSAAPPLPLLSPLAPSDTGAAARRCGRGSSSPSPGGARRAPRDAGGEADERPCADRNALDLGIRGGLPRRRGSEVGLPRRQRMQGGLPRRRGSELGLPRRRRIRGGLPRRRGWWSRVPLAMVTRRPWRVCGLPISGGLEVADAAAAGGS